jgi:ABC-type bacteriocin/lantibiotic exporter with double-glycine peptidase domain
MTRLDLACLGMVILGFVLFLYGANFFDVVIGWVGVYLIIGGILVFLLFYIYNELTKKVEDQNP